MVVTDPSGLHDDDATTATVRAVVEADMLLDNNGSTIDARKTGYRSTRVGLQETSTPYSDLDPASVRMTHNGPAGFVTECAPDTRSFVTGDMNADGVPDLDMRFGNKCLANLFNNVPDNTVVTVTITGEFSSSGGTVPLHAERELTIRVKHRQFPILAIASPNPFNPETAISYTVQNSGSVTIKIFAVDGRLIRTLKQGEQTEPGTHEVSWNGTDNSGRHMPSGIYFVKTTQKTGGVDETMTLKVTLAK